VLTVRLPHRLNNFYYLKWRIIAGRKARIDWAIARSVGGREGEGAAAG